jgi:ATP adenylyltransferase
LRYCPSLAKKPTPKNSSKPKTKVDVFDNPKGELVIKECRYSDPDIQGSEYVLVLNKFPIIENHFIMASKKFVEQTMIRDQDVRAVYGFLTAWESVADSRRVFAFFNSGPSSGASQQHLHIQFLPVDDIKAGEDSGKWELLVDSILPSTSKVEISDLPFLTFVKRFPENCTPREVAEIFSDLLDRTKSAWSAFHEDSDSSDDDVSEEDFSFNMGITTEGIVLAPRIQESAILKASNGREIGTVALNGTMLGGTLMVKRKEEWDFLRSTPNVLDNILEKLGIPTSSVVEPKTESSLKPPLEPETKIAVEKL